MLRNPLHFPASAALAALLLSRLRHGPAPRGGSRHGRGSRGLRARPGHQGRQGPHRRRSLHLQAAPLGPVLITNATVLTAAGDRIEGGSVLLQDGRSPRSEPTVAGPGRRAGGRRTGKWVTPGLIDAHSHLGVYAVARGRRPRATATRSPTR